MKIPVLGMDPSLTHWGLATSMLDLSTGTLDPPKLLLVIPEKLTHKQVRQNSTDLYVAEQLANIVVAEAIKAKAIFVEVPVGSQSARAMASYGVCVGILGVLRSQGLSLVEVTAGETKKALTGNKNATKQQMIDKAVELYPSANWTAFYPGQRKGQIPANAEHVADAIGTIHAGVKTPTFQNLMRLFKGV
jgi:Holliday junction resolvasome RuvABC endonuclease subunit